MPEGPAIAIANEFFDALPVGQFIKDRDGWHERMVGLADDKLAFVAAPDPLFGHAGADLPAGTTPGAASGSADRAACRAASRQHGGAALIIDYGHAESGFGDTLAGGARAHIRRSARRRRAKPTSPRMSISPRSRSRRRAAAPRRMGRSRKARSCAARHRAARRTLKAKATPQQAADIDSALARLTAPDQMGELFKVMAIAHPKLGTLPGFDS